jgi:hypothetical protein
MLARQKANMLILPTITKIPSNTRGRNYLSPALISKKKRIGSTIHLLTLIKLRREQLWLLLNQLRSFIIATAFNETNLHE